MTMQDIRVKQGFAVIVAFYYHICFFKNPVTTILKVGYEDCVQENNLPLWGPGGKAPSLWAILAIFFSQKTAILMPFERHFKRFLTF